MNLFFTTDIDGDLARFHEEESRHLAQVLRKSVGDEIHLINGQGLFAKAILQSVHKKECLAQIVERQQNYNERAFQLHIAIAPTKNINRLEWFLEKVTEIGIDSVALLLCERSERKKVRLDRLNKIVLSATKQSLKAYLPTIVDLTPFEAFVKQHFPKGTKKCIAWCDYTNNQHLKHNYQAKEDVIILIGPEGDFSPKEVQLALENGFSPIGLGKQRLRTETAGITACAIINTINET